MENMVAPGDKVILHGEVVEIAQETVIITLAGGMADLVAVPVQYLEKEAE
jgi:preprotein translocase subunit YajC